MKYDQIITKLISLFAPVVFLELQCHNSQVVHSHNQSIDWRLLIQGRGHENTDRRKQHRSPTSSLIVILFPEQCKHKYKRSQYEIYIHIEPSQ